MATPRALYKREGFRLGGDRLRRHTLGLGLEFRHVSTLSRPIATQIPRDRVAGARTYRLHQAARGPEHPKRKRGLHIDWPSRRLSVVFLEGSGCRFANWDGRSGMRCVWRGVPEWSDARKPELGCSWRHACLTSEADPPPGSCRPRSANQKPPDRFAPARRASAANTSLPPPREPLTLPRERSSN